MKQSIFSLLLFLFSCFGDAYADSNAVCNLSFTQSQSSYSFNTNSAPTLGLTVKRNGTSSITCNWFFTFSYGAGGSYTNRRIVNGSYTMPMQIWKDLAQTKVLKDFPDLTATDDVLDGSFPASSGNVQSNASYYPALGAITYQRFGTYSDTFTIKLYSGTYNGTNSLVQTRTVNLDYAMAKKIDLSLVGTGAPFNILSTSQAINFGTLSAGQQQAIDIVLMYNAGYSIKFSSANNGNLKHSSFADVVPYSMTVLGNPVSLSGSSSFPVTVSSGTGVSAAAGQRFPVVATVGSLGTARAGSYSDTITVTVATTE